MTEQINNIDENIVKTIVEIYDYDERAYKIDEKNVSKSRYKKIGSLTVS